MKLNKPFKLFANCIPVKGANRSVVCDLQRYDIKLIPNDLFEILDNYEERTISAIKKIYNNEFDEIIDEYFSFLIENEFIYFSNSLECFSKLSLKWDSPSSITNAILDININSEYRIEQVIKQLDNLFCQHIEIRFFDIIKINNLKMILDFIKKLKPSILSISILILFYDKHNEQEFKNLLKEYKRLTSIKIFNAKTNRHSSPQRNNMGYLIYSTENIDNNLSCGKISQSFFVINTPMFTESQVHNSCLNRKISIDTKGNIKNCPSMSQSFGNIKDTTLEEALNHKDFKKYWNIAKGQIDVCKDCEFRYVCTDCRAYIEKPEDKYSKPLKCGYDPYTNKWEEWSTNPLKQKAIEYYGFEK